MNLKGKVALVTGAAQNIGRSIAMELAAAGADLIINTKTQKEKAESVAEEICRLDQKAIVLMADIAILDQVERMVQSATEHFGHIDILVNNAAVRPSIPFLEMEPQQWHDVLGVNLHGTFHCCRTVIPYMLQNGWGRIINMIGWTAFAGFANRAHTVAAKAGVHGLTRALAIEFAAKNITVNSVAVAYVETVRKKEWYPNWPSEEELRRQIPMQRQGRMDEVGKVVAFVASEDSSYITGQVIHANGGRFIS